MNKIYTFFVFLSFLLISVTNSFQAFADGSKDLYPSGAQGGRAYLRASETASAAFPFPNLGTHYVYAEAGERIALASSAQAYGDENAIRNANRNNIRLYGPSGNQITLTTGTGSDTRGLISSRTAEVAGPQLPGQSGGDRYTPIYHEVTVTGIYKVEYLSTSRSSTEARMGYIAANGNWTQANSSNYLAAWDISVAKQSGGSWNWVPGRVYTTVLNMDNPSYGGDSGSDNNNFRPNSGFHGKFKVLTRDGYVYNVDNNGNQGISFTFMVNNRGFHAIGDPNTPSYKSIEALNAGAVTSRYHDPRKPDAEAAVTQKIFYTLPDGNMPEKALGGPEANKETWLRIPEKDLDVNEITVEGVEGSNNQLGNKGAYIKFYNESGGDYYITIRPKSGSAISFPERELSGTSAVGENKILWDGKDGGGNSLPDGIADVEIELKLRGAEVHFPYIDMELNHNGIILELLTTDLSAVKSDIVYWDDSDIRTVNTNTYGSMTTPRNASHVVMPNGTSSNTNGHIWGTGSNRTSGTFGDDQGMDTWTFIEGPSVKADFDVVIKEADLEIVSITSDKSTLKVGEDIIYTVVAKNGGPSDVEKAPFAFNAPPGFEITDIQVNSICAVEHDEGVTTSNGSSSNNTYKANLDLINGCEITYEFTVSPTPDADYDTIEVDATIMRPNDVTDPDATNPDPTVPPTDPYYEIENNGFNGVSNNIKEHKTSAFVGPLTAVKSIVNDPLAVIRGDAITYKIVISNPNNTNIVGVNVSDVLSEGFVAIRNISNGGSYDSGTRTIAWNGLTVQANDDLEITFEVTVDPDLSVGTTSIANLATITDPEYPNDPLEPQIDVPVATLSLLKAGTLNDENGDGLAQAGETITYTFTVQNIGGAAINDITIADPLITVTGGPINLAPGASDATTFSGTYTIKQEDIDAGGVYNLATVMGKDPDGDDLSGTSTDPNPLDPTDDNYDPNRPDHTFTELLQVSDLTFIKESALTTDHNTNGKADKDDVITYTFTVENTGTVTLTNVAITDDLDGLGALTYTWPDAAAVGTLLPGEIVTAEATYTITQADVDAGKVVNMAIVDADTPTDAPYVPTTDSGTPTDPGKSNEPGTPVEVPVDQVSDLAFLKESALTTDINGNGEADKDDVITYTFTVENTGTVTLTDVEITDGLQGLSALTYTWPDASSVGTLLPGEIVTATATYTITQSDVDVGKVSNMAIVNADTPTGADPIPPTESSNDPNDPGKPNEPGVPVEVPVNQVSDLTFVKESALTKAAGNTASEAEINDVITYTFTVENTGTVTLTDVAITDGLQGLSALSYTWPDASSVGTLLPGEIVTATAEYTITQADVDAGKVSNMAIVEVNTPPTAPNVPPTESSNDPTDPGKPNEPGTPVEVPVDQVSDLTFIKESALTTDHNTNGKADKDDVITYTFTVGNTGTVTLTNVAITDGLQGLSALSYTWPDASSVGTLLPGEIVTAEATYTITQADVDAGKVSNMAIVNAGTPTGADPIPPTESSNDPTDPGKPNEPGVPVEVPVNQVSDLAFVKESALTKAAGNTASEAEINDVITYTFTVENTGTVTLTDVEITDGLQGLSALTYTWPDAAAVGTLLPGEIVTAEATYTIAQSDVDAGKVSNMAIVNADTPTGADPIPPTESSNDPTDPGKPNEPGVPVEVPVNQVSDLTFLKESALTTDINGNGEADKDDVITYTFTVGNTGTVTLTDVEITDGLQGLSALTYTWPDAAAVGTLLPGEIVTATAEYTITQSDVDAGKVSNMAIVDADTPTGTDPIPPTESSNDPTDPGKPNKPGVPVEVPVNQVSDLAFVKESALTKAAGNTASEAEINDVITYTFTVENTGTVTLTDVAITDDLDGLGTIAYTWPGTTGTLLPGEVVTATAEYTVTQGDVDAGKVINMAIVDADTPTGADPIPPTESSNDPTDPGKPNKPGVPVEVPVNQVSDLTFLKESALTTDINGNGEADKDDVITYTFTVENTGTVTLTDVEITDDLTGLGTIDYTWPGTAGTLLPGEIVTAEATYTITQADVDAGKVTNMAIVNADTPTGADPIPPTESSNDPNDPGKPNEPGVPVEVPVNQVSDLAFLKESALTTDINGNGEADKDDVITYTFTVENTGTVTLTDVEITDGLQGLSALSYTWPDASSVGTLLPGEIVTATAEYTITQSDVDAGKVVNMAIVDADTPTGADPIPPTESSNDPNDPGKPNEPGVPVEVPVNQVSDLTFLKESALTTDINGNSEADKDDVITYTFTVENTGTITLTDVEITDGLQGLSALSYTWPDASSVGTLLPGEIVTATAEYTITQSDVDAGKVVNMAIVNADTPTGADPIPPTESSNDPNDPGKPNEPGVPVEVPVNQVSDLTFLKESSLTTDINGNGEADKDDVITYTFTVENTGTVTLTDVEITDDLTGLGTINYNWPGTASTLLPGEIVTATAEYTITQADVDAGKVSNMAIVNADTPTGADPIPPTESSNDPNDPGKPGQPGVPVEVPLTQTPALTLTKSVDRNNTYDTLGDKIEYTIVVTNSGNVTLTNVQVTDDNADDKNVGSIAELKVGEDRTFTAYHTITQADLDAGVVYNIATATGKDPKDRDVTGKSTDNNPLDPNDPDTPDPDTNCPDCTITPLPSNPSLTLEKTGVLSQDGDTIEYTFVVENTGNVTIDNIEVNDPKIANITLDKTKLAPGETSRGTATYTITQAEKDAGVVLNRATVEGDDPNKNPVGPTDSTDPNNPTDPDNPTEVEVPSSPALHLEKTGVLSQDGNTIEYSFLVENIGNVTIDQIVVSDDKTGMPTIILDKITLAPSETATGTATYTVTQSEKDAGEVINQATVQGEDPDGKPTDPVKSTDPSKPGTEVPTIVSLNQKGAIDLTKTVSSTAPADGYQLNDRIEYSITVSNIGNVTLKDVLVTDDNADEVTVGRVDVLEVGESRSFTAYHSITQADLNAGVVYNIAKAIGKDPNNEDVEASSRDNNPTDPNDPGYPGVDPDCPTCTVTPIGGEGSLKLVKTSKSGSYRKAGDVIEYELVLTNTGSVTITDILLIDDNADMGSLSPARVNILQPGESVTAKAIHTITQADVDAGAVYNLATAIGKDPKDRDVRATSSDGNPSDPNDPNAPPVDPNCPTCTITPIEQEGSLSLVKTAKSGKHEQAGDRIEYELVLTNTGSTTVSSIQIRDDNADAGSITPASIAALEPGKSVTIKAVHTITQEDLNARAVYNIATAKGKDPNGEDVTGISRNGNPVDPNDPNAPPVNPDCPTCTITPIGKGSSMTLTKAAKPSTSFRVGDAIEYELVLTNTGSTTLRDIVVKDDNADAGSLSPSRIDKLEPGESVLISARHTITQRDKELGYVYNIAKATGNDPSGKVVEVESKDPNPIDPSIPTDPNCPDCTVTPIEPDDLKIPNVFTPNGDGYNDSFHILGLESYDHAELTIFNRWGNEVYRNKNYRNDWDGNNLNEGTYYYLVVLKKNGKESVHKGWVLLKR